MAGCPLPATAQGSSEDLAKAAQNPLASLISVPFQNSSNFNVGATERTLNVLNIQPVVPFSAGPDWNVITRTIVPIIQQPGLVQGQDSVSGIGDIQFNAFLSPKTSAGWIWGLGAVVQLPTHSDERLGNDRWGLGPTAVALRLEKGNPWVYGALVNNSWSLGGADGGPKFNQLLLQPFINYNLPGGLYLTSSPVITANWKAAGSQQWTVPLGAGIGKIFRIGTQPVNAQISAYSNVVRPDLTADWSLRVQLQLMFPK
ncbi:MAG: neuromedin U [Chitinophagaceae bacterium]|nr:neuromedin U [Rubrivivax sp.]